MASAGGWARGSCSLQATGPKNRASFLASLFARLRGKISVSYPRWDPSGLKALAPAPEVLQAYRLSTGDGTLAFEDLERHLGDAESRMPRADLPGDADTADVWLRALNTGDGRLRHGLDAVARSFPALGRGLAADRALQGSHATVHAGILGSKSSARSSQQVAGRVFSASGLGDLGACPRRFLLKYVLKAYPPDDPDYDPHRWLNALDRGGVLHRVYERTLRKSRAAGVETGFRQSISTGAGRHP